MRTEPSVNLKKVLRFSCGDEPAFSMDADYYCFFQWIGGNFMYKCTVDTIGGKRYVHDDYMVYFCNREDGNRYYSNLLKNGKKETALGLAVVGDILNEIDEYLKQEEPEIPVFPGFDNPTYGEY